MSEMLSASQNPVSGPALRERAYLSFSGFAMLGLALLLVLLVVWGVYRAASFEEKRMALLTLLTVPVVFIMSGFFMLQPRESAILTFFGRYVGTDRSEGLRWANPFFSKRKVSLRARNLNAPTLKVNDQRGNPIEISAAVVWAVQDTAQAVFEVEDFERYVQIQAEAALRHLASVYPYDEGDHEAGPVTTLRGGMDEVSEALKQELQARFQSAGVQVIDAKLTHLAYAPEIAQVMLRRQQAEAIISARNKIVQGAVSMVEQALKGLSEREIVELDDERKAAMVSNLLVVLCSDKDTQPIVNTGTLYN